MKKTNDVDILAILYTVMVPHIQYSMYTINSLLSDTLGKTHSQASFDKLIAEERKKKIPRIIKVTANSYIINPKSYKKVKKQTVDGLEKDSIVRLARIIAKMIHSDNKEFIRHWLNLRVKEYTKQIVEDIVKEEVKIELLPVLISKIDEKIKLEVSKKISKALETVVASLE